MLESILLPLLALAAEPVATAPPAAAAKAEAERPPAAEWTSRMIMSFTPEGELNGCRLEASGAMKQASGEDANCLATAAVKRLGDMPEARTNLIFEQHFVPAEVSSIELDVHPGDELLSRQLALVDIARDGSVVSCRQAPAAEAAKEGESDPCELVAEAFVPPVDRAGNQVALTGTMIVSVYLRSEVLA